jgi:hypothetical protein
VTAACLFASVGRAQTTEAGSPEACTSAYERAQEQEKSYHLRAARELLVTCARAACGPALLQQCTSRFIKLDSAEIPSILPRVTDDTGAPRVDVQVRMDGELLTLRLGGQALAVDPGVHEFAFSTESGLVATQRISIAQGQRNRPLMVSLHAQGVARERQAETSAQHVRGSEKGHAANPRAVCATALKTAQERERSGHLRDARELLMTCARRVCGPALLRECSTRFTELDSVEVPSIVPVVTDESGQPRVDVQVRMDGQLIASRLEGQALPVDPGLHEFTFNTDSGLSATQKILVVQGELNRTLPVSLRGSEKTPVAETSAAPDTHPAPTEALATPAPTMTVPEDQPREDGRSAAPYLIGGATLAAVEAGAVAVYLRKGDTSHLAADVSIGVSLGVGAAAVGVATWLFLSSHTNPDKPAPRSARSARSAYVFDVAPTPSGALASVAGAF